MKLHVPYDHETERCTIGGRDLHCGDCFQIKMAGSWTDTRIEHGGGEWIILIGNRWYSVNDYHQYEARFYP